MYLVSEQLHGVFLASSSDAGIRGTDRAHCNSAPRSTGLLKELNGKLKELSCSPIALVRINLTSLQMLKSCLCGPDLTAVDPRLDRSCGWPGTDRACNSAPRRAGMLKGSGGLLKELSWSPSALVKIQLTSFANAQEPLCALLLWLCI